MTNAERNRRTGRATAIGVAVSAAAHVAAFAWITLPAPDALESKAPAMAMIVPAIVSPIELLPKPDMAAAASGPVQNAPAAADAGGAGGTPDAPPPAGDPAPTSAAPVTASAESGEELMVAVADTAPAPVMAPSGLGRTRLTESTEAAGANGVQPAVHVPGSAARAKSGGSGSGTGIGTGSGSRGGIIIGGPKRHPKRHPPRGIPGRRGW